MNYVLYCFRARVLVILHHCIVVTHKKLSFYPPNPNHQTVTQGKGRRHVDDTNTQSVTFDQE